MTTNVGLTHAEIEILWRLATKAACEVITERENRLSGEVGSTELVRELARCREEIARKLEFLCSSAVMRHELANAPCLASPEQVRVAMARHPAVIFWRNDAVRAAAEICDRYGATDAADNIRRLHHVEK
jgi:hypothetical protein